MITPKESASRDVLERIATDFRRRGYEVLVEPRGKDLPPFLQGATPDLIARSGKENLVIEVKRSPKGVDPAQLSAIAQRIGNEPGWRFVLMAANPDEGKTDNLEVLSEADVRARLREVDELLRTRHFDAALMLAWAATEAILRLLVARYRLPIARDDTASLIRTLASEGFLEGDAFHQLNQAFSYRSALAHGQRPRTSEIETDTKSLTQSLSRLSEALLRELSAPAA